MHDYHAISVLIEKLLETGESIDEVRIKVGVDSSPESLQQAYEMLTHDTPLEGSRLLIEERLDVRRCPGCDELWRATREDVLGHMIICPWCGQATPVDKEAGIEVVEVSATRV
jgi:Zn finger protein HypA/HybF involved in hydrogenase expression